MAKKENQADFMKMFNEEPQTAPVQPLPKKQLSIVMLSDNNLKK